MAHTSSSTDSGSDGKPADPPVPTSAREASAPSRPGGEQSPPRPLPAAADAPTSERRRQKPTPVRKITGSPPTAESGAGTEAEQAGFSVGDDRWTARILGRSGGGEAPQLLLLGFWREGAEDGDHVREAFVVARALSDLSSESLERALSRGREPPAPPGAPPKREDRRRGRRR